jgi:hypothetical protein
MMHFSSVGLVWPVSDMERFLPISLVYSMGASVLPGRLM